MHKGILGEEAYIVFDEKEWFVGQVVYEGSISY